MAAVAVGRPLKPKLTMSSVRGHIIVTAEDGERIGQWGGTECFLSLQTGLGPCLVVRSSRHKSHEGTFFRLTGLKRVLSTYATDGKLTLVVPHERRVCTIFVETTQDVDELRIMAATLQDKREWRNMERNVARKKSRQRGSRVTKADLRDPSVFDATNGTDWEDAYDNDINVDPSENQPHSGHDNSTIATASHPPTHGEQVTAERNGKQHDTSTASKPLPSSTEGPTWTIEQTRAMHWIQSGQSVFVTGAAGTGKTQWLLHVLSHILPRTEEGATVVTATTGVAARLLGGCTLHAFAGIGKGDGSVEELYERVRNRPEAVRAWRRCVTLVVDEIGALNPHILNALDAIARRVRNVLGKPFGGIQLLFVGDFLQLPPVNRHDHPSSGDAERKFCFECPVWDELQLRPVAFRTSQRHREDPNYALCMRDIRYGRYTHRVEALLSACQNKPLAERYGVEATVIMARRQDVDKYNRERLHAISDVFFHRYESEDYAAIPGADLDRDVSLPSTLQLKVGAQVVLLAALPEAPHLSNGDLGVVLGFAEQARGAALPIVCFAHRGEEVMVPRVRMDVLGADGRMSASRTQIPLLLAWALTVHRVQGMTLPMIRVRLDQFFFEAGQAYVALTRARGVEDVAIDALDPNAIRADARAVAFYEGLFPQERWTPEEGERDAGRPVKRPRSPLPGRAWNGDWEKTVEVNSTEMTPAADERHEEVAVELLSAIPKLTQESDVVDSSQFSQGLIQVASLRALLTEDD